MKSWTSLATGDEPPAPGGGTLGRGAHGRRRRLVGDVWPARSRRYGDIRKALLSLGAVRGWTGPTIEADPVSSSSAMAKSSVQAKPQKGSSSLIE